RENVDLLHFPVRRTEWEDHGPHGAAQVTPVFAETPAFHECGRIAPLVRRAPAAEDKTHVRLGGVEDQVATHVHLAGGVTLGRLVVPKADTDVAAEHRVVRQEDAL